MVTTLEWTEWNEMITTLKWNEWNDHNFRTFSISRIFVGLCEKADGQHMLCNIYRSPIYMIYTYVLLSHPWGI